MSMQQSQYGGASNHAFRVTVKDVESLHRSVQRKHGDLCDFLDIVVLQEEDLQVAAQLLDDLRGFNSNLKSFASFPGSFKLLSTDTQDVQRKQIQEYSSVAYSTLQEPIRPTIRIGINGPFGAGQSTLINALLGQELLPARTSNSTCTLVDMSVEYPSGQHENCTAQIQFLTEHRWVKDCDGAKDCDGDDDEDEDASGFVRAMIAGYAGTGLTREEFMEATGQELLEKLPTRNLLGSTLTIKGDNPADLMRKMNKYLKHVADCDKWDNKVADTLYWPVIHKARIYLDAAILKHGVVLFDGSGFDSQDGTVVLPDMVILANAIEDIAGQQTCLQLFSSMAMQYNHGSIKEVLMVATHSDVLAARVWAEDHPQDSVTQDISPTAPKAVEKILSDLREKLRGVMRKALVLEDTEYSDAVAKGLREPPRAVATSANTHLTYLKHGKGWRDNGVDQVKAAITGLALSRFHQELQRQDVALDAIISRLLTRPCMKGSESWFK